MKLAALLLLAGLSANAQSDSLHLLVADGAKPVLVSNQFKFTEGPAPDRKGNIYFTDQPNNAIWIFDTKGKLKLFSDKSGRSNGLYVDKKGNILACADADNELWSFSPKGGHTVLMDNFEGKKLNGPNDLWIHPNGDIYFTDPYYQRNYWARQKPDIEAMRVYRLQPGSNTPEIVADDIVKPNGIVGTPDGSSSTWRTSAATRSTGTTSSPAASSATASCLPTKAVTVLPSTSAAISIYAGMGYSSTTRKGSRSGISMYLKNGPPTPASAARKGTCCSSPRQQRCTPYK